MSDGTASRPPVSSRSLVWAAAEPFFPCGPHRLAMIARGFGQGSRGRPLAAALGAEVGEGAGPASGARRKMDGRTAVVGRDLKRGVAWWARMGPLAIVLACRRESGRTLTGGRSAVSAYRVVLLSGGENWGTSPAMVCSFSMPEK
jgi:hypothetical protein